MMYAAVKYCPATFSLILAPISKLYKKKGVQLITYETKTMKKVTAVRLWALVLVELKTAVSRRRRVWLRTVLKTIAKETILISIGTL